jgi:ferredoxin--NADP+ reductase
MSAVDAEVHDPTSPLLPEARMHVAMPNAPVAARIASTRLCMRGKSASFVRHVEIDLAGTPLEGAFRAGQSFGVVPAGVDAAGKPHKVRLYSLASPTWGEDGHGRIIATTPKRMIAEREPQSERDDASDHSLFLGVCSNWLCDRRAGDSVDVSGPNGKRFLLPADPSLHDYLFLATGTGVAPFRGFLKELLEGPPSGSPAAASWRRCESRIELVMGSPYTTDLLYDDFLRDLASKHANFRYHTAISREPRIDPAGRVGRGEYVHQAVERMLSEPGGAMDLLRSPRTLVYMCGLAGMQVGVFQLLARERIEGYTRIADELAGKPPAEWTSEEIKRRVRPTHRCMLEVY